MPLTASSALVNALRRAGSVAQLGRPFPGFVDFE